MPIFVHLADKNDSNKILNGGIKIGKNRKGIYCMPVTQNFLVSHQWLRELKRTGVKNIVGVYFRLNSAEKVWAAPYNKVHKEITIGTAIKHLMQLADPLGYVMKSSLIAKLNQLKYFISGICHKLLAGVMNHTVMRPGHIVLVPFAFLPAA